MKKRKRNENRIERKKNKKRKLSFYELNQTKYFLKLFDEYPLERGTEGFNALKERTNEQFLFHYETLPVIKVRQKPKQFSEKSINTRKVMNIEKGINFKPNTNDSSINTNQESLHRRSIEVSANVVTKENSQMTEKIGKETATCTSDLIVLQEKGSLAKEEMKESTVNTNSSFFMTKESIMNTNSSIFNLKEAITNTKSSAFNMKEAITNTNSSTFNLKEIEVNTLSSVFNLEEKEINTEKKKKASIEINTTSSFFKMNNKDVSAIISQEDKTINTEKKKKESKFTNTKKILMKNSSANTSKPSKKAEMLEAIDDFCFKNSKL